ncbi:hypothetical protein SJAG_02740 [Schizosaccharomyces japonicus yFS275]|uniref:Uncharacterized protein n=1 Tax=Schizosaccharomyces japonicus (strain yFS275 / FY16936) TaxID=402676 RepID=B6K120_SCHJY|nr:hypothetical protein SJAG_02740 [Schizosaccharomyces japonicus yFS275]EEB07641.1 hypothetical protein SJAG_02740 [Schizosaccharomyces japonicus yFS275]
MSNRRLSANVHIDLHPIRSEILLPFHDRQEEMAGLMACNESFFKAVEQAVGDSTYAELTDIWLHKNRNELSDAELLNTTRSTLLNDTVRTRPENLNSDDQIRFRLWRQFCSVVGYDDPTPLPVAQEDPMATAPTS